MYDYKNNPGSYTFEDNGATAEYHDPWFAIDEAGVKPPIKRHRHIPVNTLVLCGVVFLLGLALFPLVYLLATGDFPGSRMFYGLQEDDTLVTFLLNLR